MNAKIPLSNSGPLHSSSPGDVYWKSANGSDRTALATPQLLDHELYLAAKARTGNRYPNQRNYHGLTWFSNTHQQIWFESLLERHALLWLDYTHDVVAIACQPMTMTFSDGSKHTPDFIALHSNHRQVVYDVKPTRHFPKAQAQFDKTADLCRTVGWGYEILTELPRQVHVNLDWIASFRQPRFAPSPADAQCLFNALETPLSIEEAATWLPPHTGIPSIYHLVWAGRLHCDLTSPLSNTTIIGKEKIHAHS